MTEDPRGPADAPGAPDGTGSRAPGVPTADAPPRGRLRRWGWVIAGIAIVVLIVVVLAPLASPDPDGLESVAKQQGWLGAAQDAVHGLLPGYSVPGLDGAAGTIVSGLVGVGIVLLAILGLGWLLRRRAPRGR
jgi:cobalt/nickel transport protein